MAALEHKWDGGKVTKEPTTSEDGIMTFTCTACSETRTEKIDKLIEDGIIAEGECGNDVAWQIDKEGVLHIYATMSPTMFRMMSRAATNYAMNDYAKAEDAPWYAYRDRIKAVVVESGVTAVGANAFAACEAATDIIISETVEEVGSGAFLGCDKLEEVTFLGEAPSFGEECFGEKEVTIYHMEDAESWTEKVVEELGKNISLEVHVHDYSATKYDPDCTEEGYTEFICSCGDSYIDNIVAALGHKWDGGVVTKEPTTSEKGEKTFTCTVCSETRTESIGKLPEEIKPDEPMENPFTDVMEKDFFFEPVMWAVSNNVTSGLSADSFGPGKGCTRAQVVTFLWRAAGEPAPQSSENPFTDIKEGQYYYDAVLWAVENGVTTGLSATTFGPNADCNRGQIVTFLWRAMGKPTPQSSENPFADVPESQYYYDAVLWAVEKGITTGVSAKSFAPNATCTRGQIVTFLYRAYQ